MNSIERFYATIERRPVDRPAAWLGIPSPQAQPGLFAEYGVTGLHELKLAVGDDFYSVAIPYRSEYSSSISSAFDWYLDGKVRIANRTLTADGCFKNCETVEDLAFFKWPEPEKYIDPDECRHLVDQAPEDKAVLGVLWSTHFQNTCASFGMETALMNMVSNPELVEAVDKKIVDFFLRANEAFYKAVCGPGGSARKGGRRLHAVLIGDDVGTQRGLLVSPALIRRFVIPGCRALVEQAHSYGLKVIYHSCGSVADAIPDMIEAGVDAIHPIQALAAGMDAAGLRARYGDRVSFCGGVDTQQLLVHGTPEDVKGKVRELRALFPTGLIISPSHEAILDDVPPGNIRALFEEAVKIY
jgi:uroporphyrinogen decarboxylase